MKTHDVILKAMAKKISWLSAAEIIGITPRSMRRRRERLELHGDDGLARSKEGKTQPETRAAATCERCWFCTRKYFDFNVKHFHEKLKEVHGI